MSFDVFSIELKYKYVWKDEWYFVQSVWLVAVARERWLDRYVLMFADNSLRQRQAAVA